MCSNVKIKVPFLGKNNLGKRYKYKSYFFELFFFLYQKPTSDQTRTNNNLYSGSHNSAEFRGKNWVFEFPVPQTMGPIIYFFFFRRADLTQ